MKKTLWAIVIASCLGLGMSACVVHPHRSHHHRPKAKKRHHKKQHRKHCAPSHYWDGHKCRHKGKGKGARKHDY